MPANGVDGAGGVVGAAAANDPGVDGVSWMPANGFDGAGVVGAAGANDRGADGVSWMPANGLDSAAGAGAALFVAFGANDPGADGVSWIPANGLDSAAGAGAGLFVAFGANVPGADGVSRIFANGFDAFLGAAAAAAGFEAAGFTSASTAEIVGLASVAGASGIISGGSLVTISFLAERASDSVASAGTSMVLMVEASSGSTAVIPTVSSSVGSMRIFFFICCPSAVISVVGCLRFLFAPSTNAKEPASEARSELAGAGESGIAAAAVASSSSFGNGWVTAAAARIASRAMVVSVRVGATGISDFSASSSGSVDSIVVAAVVVVVAVAVVVVVVKKQEEDISERITGGMAG